jgi:hypothetical protein
MIAGCPVGGGVTKVVGITVGVAVGERVGAVVNAAVATTCVIIGARVSTGGIGVDAPAHAARPSANIVETIPAVTIFENILFGNFPVGNECPL